MCIGNGRASNGSWRHHWQLQLVGKGDTRDHRSKAFSEFNGWVGHGNSRWDLNTQRVVSQNRVDRPHGLRQEQRNGGQKLLACNGTVIWVGILQGGGTAELGNHLNCFR